MTGSQRRCHAIKPNRGTEAASNWLFFDCETWPDASGPQPNVIEHKWRLAVAYACRLEKQQRRCEAWKRCAQPVDFWNFLRRHLSRDRPLWVCSHNLAFDFPIAGGWSMLQDCGLDKWRLVLGDGPQIMTGHIDGCKVVFIDSLNYARLSLAEIGKRFGLAKWPLPAFTAADEDWYKYCEQDVRIVTEAMLSIVGLHRQHDLGVVGKTLAQCAFNNFRHQHYEHPIVIHEDEEVLGWERQAYYGGRVECAYIGPLTGEHYFCDVNSLYPYIMATTRLPWRLKDKVEDVPVDWLSERLQLHEGVAQCLIDTSTDTYPVRRQKHLPRVEAIHSTARTYAAVQAFERPIYAHGNYVTWLCGQELREALERGHVKEVKRAALYDRAILFKSYVETWYGRRRAFHAAGDKWREGLAKAYLQTLSGVWAKRAPKWVTADDQIPPKPWARWTCYDAIEKAIRRFRAIANVPQEMVEEGESFDSSPILSACITAAARCYMRRLQAQAGARGWLYEDTDSLLLTAAGFDTLCLAGCVDRARLGALRCERIADSGAIHGVKHYEFAGQTTLKGIRPDAEKVAEKTYQQWQWGGMSAALHRQGKPTVEVRRMQIKLTGGYSKGEVGADGWTRPYVLLTGPAWDW